MFLKTKSLARPALTSDIVWKTGSVAFSFSPKPTPILSLTVLAKRVTSGPTTVVSAYGQTCDCVCVFPVVAVTDCPVTISPTMLAILSSPLKEYLKSPAGVNVALDAFLGSTVTALSSSPIIQHSAGTTIGSTSIYLPVDTLINVLCISLAGILVATPAVIASVIIFIFAVISVVTLSASNAAFLYCTTIAVELSPFCV